MDGFKSLLRTCQCLEVVCICDMNQSDRESMRMRNRLNESAFSQSSTHHSPPWENTVRWRQPCNLGKISSPATKYQTSACRTVRTYIFVCLFKPCNQCYFASVTQANQANKCQFIFTNIQA